MGSELLPSSGETRNIKIFIDQHKDLKMRLITLVAFVAVIACTVAAPPQDGPNPKTVSSVKPKPDSTAKPKPPPVSTAKPKPPHVSTAKPKHPTTSSHSGSSKIYSFSYVTIAMCVLGKY